MSGLPGTARAFATYSLVPYLGILFCPGAVVLGTVGVVRSYRSREAGGDSSRGICYASTIVGVVITAVQLLLWWVLYQAPMWANRF
jgi:ABC-type spermidine/putrescine transport system permease subunit II